MNNKPSVLVPVLIGVVFVSALLLLLVWNGRSRDISDDSTKNVGAYMLTPLPTSSVGVPSLTPTAVTGPITYTVVYQGTPVEVINRRYILAGKSVEQIADYSAEKFAPWYLGSQDPVQIRLARSVSRDELPQLGLGCLPSNMGREEPPYVLVILEGNFDLSSGVPTTAASSPGSMYHFASMVVDVWAGDVTSLKASANGAVFRTILNDPSLPEATPGPIGSCPTAIPGNYPHGAVMSGEVFPTSPPGPTTTMAPMPSPVGTTTP